MNLKNGVYYGLNSTGARIWNVVQEPRTVSEICRIIVGEFEVESVRCECDLLALLEALSAEGLIEIRGEEDDPQSTGS